MVTACSDSQVQQQDIGRLRCWCFTFTHLSCAIVTTMCRCVPRPTVKILSGWFKVQQQDVGWTLSPRAVSHNHHDNEQVPDNAYDCDQCKHDGSCDRPQDVVELHLARVVVVVVVVVVVHV